MSRGAMVGMMEPLITKSNCQALGLSRTINAPSLRGGTGRRDGTPGAAEPSW